MSTSTGVSASTDVLRGFTRRRAVDDPLAPVGAPLAALDSVFVTEQLCLSFTATMFAWGHPMQADRLYSADRLIEWLDLVGYGPLSSAPTAGQLETLRELREAIYRLVQQRLDRADVPDPRALGIVNATAELPGLPPALLDGAFTIDPDNHPHFSHLMSDLARDAIDTVAGAWSGRLRRCERVPCTHVFVDRSPSGGRRWCTSKGCGNRVRAAEFRQRKAGAA